MGVDEDGEELNLFAGFRTISHSDKKKRRVPSLRLSGAAVLIMLAVFSVVSYGIDKARLKQVENYLEEVAATVDVNQLEKENQLKRIIARLRVDVLELLKIINGCCPDGVMLDSFSFKRRQPITIIGQTKDKGKIYEFQENLQNHKDIKTVRGQSSKLGDEKKGIIFTLTFEYKDFCKR